MRVGLIEGEGKTDSRTNVFSADAAFEAIDGVKATAQAAYSQSHYDLTSGQFDTKARGHAYLFSVETRFSRQADHRFFFRGHTQGRR